MGGILSSEEKAARGKHGRREADRTLGVPWDPHGYRYREQRIRGHRSHTKGKGRSEGEWEGRGPRGRSQSLDAILEELYLSENEGDGPGSLIPRAKLAVNSRGAERRLYSRRSSSHFGSDAASLHAIHMQVERKAFERSHPNLRSSVSLPFLDQSEWEGDMEAEHASLGPPSYSKDFDACMRQLEAIELSMQAQQDMAVSTLPRQSVKEKSLQTPEDQPRSLTMPRGRLVKRQMTPTDEPIVLPPREDESSSDDSGSEQTADVKTEKEPESDKRQEEPETAIEPVLAKRQLENIIIIEPERPAAVDCEPTERPIPRGWYCNLKDQFERLDQELGSRGRKQDVSCRITGATLKNSKETTQVEEDKGSQRKHYFSQLVRSNKSLIDEELPDPDKVQNIRAMFQEHHVRLGGSLQNISMVKHVDMKPERPKSALGSRKDDEMRCLTPDSVDSGRRGVRRDGASKGGQNSKMESDRSGPRRRWTDSGSMSSGVSSDLSSCETDQESFSRETVEPVTSEDELDVADKHYIQTEILEKIRSFGTSVTYFGGQMVRCSVGPLVSPTTQAILEEIGQKQPNGVPCTRSFDEFYKKYKETSKKRKVGRTRSFAQEEMFQKPNVFNNTEIEEHKKELETAFGIRRPNGKQATVSKTRLGKCFSLDSRLPSTDKGGSSHDIRLLSKKDEKDREAELSVPCKQRQTEAPYSASRRPQVKSEYFDFNARICQQKTDMEFEEFEVCESISDKLEKMAAKRESLTNGPVVQNEGSTSATGNIVVRNAKNEGIHEDKNEGQRVKYDGSLQNDDNGVENNCRARNSVQDKLNSWEEAIQQKRLSQENHLNERKDSTEKYSLIKRGSTDDSSSQRSSSTEDIINHFEDQKKRRSVENANSSERHSSECSSESTQSIDYGNVLKETNNQDTWGKQAQLRRQSLEGSNSRRSSQESANKEEIKGGTWKRFVENRRYSSTENLVQSRKNSTDSHTGSRRNSVKKLAPLEGGINGRDFCQEARKDSLEWRRLSLNGDADTFENGISGNRSTGNRSNQSSRRSSVEKREKGSQEAAGSMEANHRTSRRGSRESSYGKRVSIDSEHCSAETTQEAHCTGTNDNNGEKESGTERHAESRDTDQTEYKITIKISQTEQESYKIGTDKFEEIVINDPEPLDSLELYFPKPEGQVTHDNPMPANNDKKNEEPDQGDPGPEPAEYKRRFDRNRNYKPQSRWPVETTVVVDMEKSEEAVPHLISHGKAHVKTTRRLF